MEELLCQENESCLELEEQQEKDIDDLDVFIDLRDNVGGDDHYVEMLFEKEILQFNKFKMEDQSLNSFDNWVQFSRVDAITWILRSREIFGFRIQTAYLSITYFDLFLSRRSIDKDKSWAVKLLSVACLSLAAKMEEVKVPLLSNIQIEDYSFESKIIQRMELLVLHTLDWKMICITPFSFLHYFIIKFKNESSSRLLVSRTVGFMLAIIKEINSMEQRPSVIAAAAILMELDHKLTRKALECKLDFISLPAFLDIENVFECYNLMQKLEMENLKTERTVNLPGYWSTSVSSAISRTKRKRLAFNDSDLDCGLPDEKRQR
ncbi:cyclin-D5-1-like [Mercurialis annua]|uniref:cyclin-D5-1-like n=1 Tax=Mercurialis annua TaxID=3986 RepID=UPI00215F6932|nr:cyclin-D5-1-like [Mercurialis annua]